MTIHSIPLRRQMIGDAYAQATSLGHRLTRFHELEVRYLYTGFEMPPEHRLLAVCQKCGREAKLPNGYGEALYMDCEPDPLGAAQAMAALTAQVPALLYSRLTQAAQALPEDIALYFEPGQFDTHRQHLWSNDGIWRLSWSLRQHPDLPITPDNPQSAAGRVELHRQVAQSHIFPVRYTGPLRDPNISDDPLRRRIRPLLPDEVGLAIRIEDAGYSRHDDHWRFRRLGGARAYRVPPYHLDFKAEHDVDTTAIDRRILALQAATEDQPGQEPPLMRRPLFVHEPAPLLMVPT